MPHTLDKHKQVLVRTDSHTHTHTHIQQLQKIAKETGGGSPCNSHPANQRLLPRAAFLLVVLMKGWPKLSLSLFGLLLCWWC